MDDVKMMNEIMTRIGDALTKETGFPVKNVQCDEEKDIVSLQMVIRDIPIDIILERFTEVMLTPEGFESYRVRVIFEKKEEVLEEEL